MMSTSTSRVTLLTDFGTADGYVGAMKGVIASIVPDIIIDDISHDIARGDVAAGAWCLATSWRFHPPGTVHVCVVDPGVGGERRAIAAQIGGHRFVAPDNGLLNDALREPLTRVVEITNRNVMRATLSNTFHGRDIFAAAGAHLASGVPLEQLGPIVTDPVLLPEPELRIEAGGLTGVVVHIDRFGNLITNVTAAHAGNAVADVLADSGAQRVRIVRTYADAEPGELIALIGSGNVLEIAVRDGSAAERLAAGRGLRVRTTSDAAPEVRNVRSDY